MRTQGICNVSRICDVTELCMAAAHATALPKCPKVSNQQVLALHLRPCHCNWESKPGLHMFIHMYTDMYVEVHIYIYTYIYIHTYLDQAQSLQQPVVELLSSVVRKGREIHQSNFLTAHIIQPDTQSGNYTRIMRRWKIRRIPELHAGCKTIVSISLA